jgi:hypothetical protein
MACCPLGQPPPPVRRTAMAEPTLFEVFTDYV